MAGKVITVLVNWLDKNDNVANGESYEQTVGRLEGYELKSQKLGGQGMIIEINT